MVLQNYMTYRKLDKKERDTRQTNTKKIKDFWNFLVTNITQNNFCVPQ